MEYLGEGLCKETWQEVDNENHPGFEPYMISRHLVAGDGKYQYLVGRIDDGKRLIVTLDGAPKKDPLKGVANCDLIVKDNEITGLRIDKFCAIKKC